MFGKEPMRFYPNIQVKIGRFGKDASDLKFHEVLEGNIVQLVQEVQTQLNHKFLTRPITFEGFQRVEKDQYPIQALREMLLNALVHRTYMGATIQMRVFDNKLSIWNEGGLPLGLTLEDLKSEHNSRPRNPIIANACFFAGYIDTWGRGTLKIIKACKEAGLPEPEIKEMNGGIEVTIYNKPVVYENSDGIVNAASNPTKLVEGLVEGLVESQKKIVRLINQKPTISKRELAEHIGISTTAIDKNLDSLKAKNIIRRVGSNKSGHWEIIVN
jgi:ATP-dependent DNA helicase RecG